jgi:hypothetical protein
VNDRWCTFPRKFPVLQCEEFTGCEPKPIEVKERKLGKMRFDKEPTVWE